MLAPTYEPVGLLVRQANQAEIMAGRLSVAEANSRHYHEVMGQVAKKLDLPYERRSNT